MYRFRPITAIALALAVLLVLGVGGYLLRDPLRAAVTGECAGDTAVSAIDATPSLAAVAGVRDDQIAATIDEALAGCDELRAVRFGATVKEIDLADVPTKVPGKTAEVRSENRPAVAAELLDHITEDVDEAAAGATASDIVAALDFIATTYVEHSDGPVHVTLVTDGFFSRAGMGTIDANDPEGAVATLQSAGMADIDLSGADITITGVGAAQEEAAYARDQIDTLQQVWTEVLSGARSVRVLEALPESSGMAARLRADAATAEAVGPNDEHEGTKIPTPTPTPTPATGGVAALSAAAFVPGGRRRRRDGEDSAWVPVAPDPAVTTMLDNAADNERGGSSAFPHEARAVVSLDDLQAQLEDERRAKASQGLVRRLIGHQILATEQRRAFVAALTDAGCRHVDEEAAILVAGGRTTRRLARPTANLIEAVLVGFDVWAVGTALATGTDSSLADGLLLAMGGALGAVMIGRTLGVELAHHDALRLIPEKDPARTFWAGTFTTHAIRPAHVAMLVGSGAGLLLLTLAMGLVRADGAGLATTLLVTLLPLFTMVGTIGVERLTANPLADQVDHAHRERERAERRVTAIARRSRSLVKARQMAALLSLVSVRVDARKAARTAIADATVATRAGAVGIAAPEASVEARAIGREPISDEQRIPSSVLRIHQLNDGHVEAIDSAAAAEANTKVMAHAATVRIRLEKAGVDLDAVPAARADGTTATVPVSETSDTDDGAVEGADAVVDRAAEKAAATPASDEPTFETVPVTAPFDPVTSTDGGPLSTGPQPNGTQA